MPLDFLRTVVILEHDLICVAEFPTIQKILAQSNLFKQKV